LGGGFGGGLLLAADHGQDTRAEGNHDERGQRDNQPVQARAAWRGGN
jgi:hypothetical protein